MTDSRTLPVAAAGGLTLATFGPQLAAALPVLIPFAVVGALAGLVIRAFLDADETAKREADEAAAAEAAEAQRLARLGEIESKWAREGSAMKAAAKIPLDNAPAVAVPAARRLSVPISAPAPAPARPAPSAPAATPAAASPVLASGSRNAIPGEAAAGSAPGPASPAPTIAAVPAPAPAKPAGPNSVAKLTVEKLAGVFAGGPLAKAAAVGALRALGFGKSAAYAALKAEGRFAARLAFQPDGRIAWKT